MKFSGEIKFPEIDHPGVPVQFVIEGRQAELVVEGESLGRWSLYDVHARRLVASAFQIDLDGTEVTFVADDPIDFAYRGVEHMAETWASMRSRQPGRRMVAVRKSRKGTTPSRIDDLKAAMEANLEVQSRPLAGEPAMPASGGRDPEKPVADGLGVDWDRRDADGSIPLVGEAAITQTAAITETAELTEPGEAELAVAAELEARLAEELRRIEEERERIGEERARLEAERAEAEQREAVRIEAYRLEMQRLEAEREELRREAAIAAERSAALLSEAVQDEDVVVEAVEPEDSPEPIVDSPIDERVEEEVSALEAPFEDAAEPEGETAEPEPAVLDLSDLEEEEEGPEDEEAAPPVDQPQPALAGAATKDRGLMGAVRAAFARGSKEHDHQFVEAPGGIGIIRYVCEVCGYVSISVGE